MAWNYNAAEHEEKTFEPIPVGKYRVRIAEVKERQSSKGNDMFEIILDVSGYNARLWYYLVFTPDNSKLVNQKLGDIFDSFGIAPGDMNLLDWIGKVGAAKVKHEDFNGEPSAKVSYFIGKKGQEELPPWQEPDRPQANSAVGSGFVPVAAPVNDEFLPF